MLNVVIFLKLSAEDLPLMKPTWSALIIDGNIFSNHEANSLASILQPTLIRLIGL